MDRTEARRKAQALVDRMTLQEAASQLLYTAAAVPAAGVSDYNWWNEALHGVARTDVATVFPQAIGMAASFDAALLRSAAEIIATEARAKYNEADRAGDHDIYKGLTFWSPNINIFRDPRWGRGHETYGEDPFLTAAMGCAFVRGLQGEGEFLKAAACAKHFAVHSGPEKLRHEFDAQVTPQDLEETYLPAFEALVREAKVEGVMGAYNRTNGEPCCANGKLMGETLFGKWGFEGYFVSDCGAIQDFYRGHKVTADAAESAALAIRAGCVVNCGFAYRATLEAVERGLLTEREVRDAAVRALTTRVMLGEFEEPKPFRDVGYDRVDCPEHRALNRQMARAGLVLLKNDGILPLDGAGLDSVAVIGPNALSRRALEGNYEGLASEYVTVVDGVRRAVPEAKLYYSMGCELTRWREGSPEGFGNMLSSAAAAARHARVTVLCLGLDADVEGEEGCTRDVAAGYADCGDKTTLRLPLAQQKLLDTVLAASDNVILVLMSGSCLDPGDEAASRCRAIVQAFYPGSQGGGAVADLLFGAYSPSGRLPVTFYRADAALPDFTDYSMENRTYRYYRGEPRWPFGYGLSYARFRYDRLSAARRENGDALVRVEVTNESAFAAREVVQVYAVLRDSRTRTPLRQLCAVQPTEIPAGETATVTMSVPAKWLRAVSPAGERLDPDGGVTLFVGGHQPDPVSDRLTGNACLEIEL